MSLLSPGQTSSKPGGSKDVTESLDAEGIRHTVFSEVTPNPRDFEVMNGAELYTRSACDAIVAIGGGSPIDCAKGIGIVISNKKHILAFEGVDTVPIPAPPLICIPTTAGTGADVSQFAIITDTTQKGEDRDHQQKDRPGYRARRSRSPDLPHTCPHRPDRHGCDNAQHRGICLQCQLPGN